MSTKSESNSSPFAFEERGTADASSRKLEYTPALIELSSRRASEIIRQASKNPELHDLANEMLKGAPSVLINLIYAVVNDETIKSDSVILDGADADQLSRLLESRRSDRSKARAKDIKKDMVACRTYIGSMYAELLIRERTGKAYTGSTASSDYDVESLAADKDALNRKIKSLQTKLCRLNKTAKFVPADAEAANQVQAEIDRLNSFKPNMHVSAKTVVSAKNLDEVRAELSKIDTSKLSDDDAAKLQDLLAKLG